MNYSTYLFLKFCSVNFLRDMTMLFHFTSEPYSQQPWRACLFAIPHEILHTRLLLWNNLVNFSWFVPRRDYILIQSRKKWHLRHRRAQLTILFNLITISFSLLILIGCYGILDSNLKKDCILECSVIKKGNSITGSSIIFFRTSVLQLSGSLVGLLLLLF